MGKSQVSSCNWALHDPKENEAHMNPWGSAPAPAAAQCSTHPSGHRGTEEHVLSTNRRSSQPSASVAL